MISTRVDSYKDLLTLTKYADRKIAYLLIWDCHQSLHLESWRQNWGRTYTIHGLDEIASILGIEKSEYQDLRYRESYHSDREHGLDPKYINELFNERFGAWRANEGYEQGFNGDEDPDVMHYRSYLSTYGKCSDCPFFKDCPRR